jgi:hypothetical protein
MLKDKAVLNIERKKRIDGGTTNFIRGGILILRI